MRFIQRRRFLQGAAAATGAFALPGCTGVAWVGDGPPARSDRRANASARPWVLWYWVNANITREGIAADLDAMHAAGIEGVFIFNIGGVDDTTLVEPAVESQSLQWWELLRFAVRRAGDLGLSVGMNVCDGWGTAGGQWITPDISAHELVWSELVLEGARRVKLPQPRARFGYYRDVAVFAIRPPESWFHDHGMPMVSSSWSIENVQRVADPAQNEIVIDTEEPGWLQYSFVRPFTLRSVTVSNPVIPVLPFISVGFSGAANNFEIQASDDGRTFRRIHKMRVPRLGWQSNLAELAHSVPATTARHFRFVYRPDAVDTVSGHDGRFLVVRTLRLASLSLSSRAVVDQLPVRSAKVWGIAAPLTDELLAADDCVRPEHVIDISDRMDADGRLDWDAPGGRWLVLRMGTTSNGIITAPSGRTGGLECDKFNPAAVRAQFDGWFGAALEQVGPDLAGNVLNVLNIDSWEGGSQNWSPVFAEEFRRRRGYDLKRLLPIMAGLPIDSATLIERFLFDVRRTIGDLLRDVFFATMAQLAHARGCLFSAQQTNASFPSDGMQHFQHVDVPNGEFWKGMPNSDKPSDIREAVSASRLYGKQIAAAESFTGQLDWSEHPFSFKAQGDEHFCIGINRLVLHVWVHQAFPQRAPGISLYGYGSFFSHTQPWWPMAGAWIDYLGRCQALLQSGQAVVDVCYYTGEDIPSRAHLPARLQPQLPAGYAYDSLNADVLLRLATVRDGRIVLPSGASYAVMVLPPDAAPMTLRIARKLQELVAAGAKVIGPRPVASPSLEDGAEEIAETTAILERLWSGSDRSRIYTDELDSVLASLSVPPDVAIMGADGVLWTHRRDLKCDSYFLSNQANHPVSFQASFRNTGHVSLYDAVRDRWTLSASQRSSQRTELTLSLEAAGSIFVVFRNDGEGPLSIAGPAPGNALELVHEDAAVLVETSVSGNWRIVAESKREIQVSVPPLPAAIAVSGPWTVRFETDASPFVRSMEQLRSWHEHDEPEIRFYSGTARYTNSVGFEATRGLRWMLKPGDFANIIRIIVNGRDLGVLWVPGTSVDATDALRAGSNTLEIVVANTWRNRLVGDRDLPPDERSTWLMPNRLGVRPPVAIAAAARLLPAGLLGPVRIEPRFCRTIPL